MSTDPEITYVIEYHSGTNFDGSDTGPGNYCYELDESQSREEVQQRAAGKFGKSLRAVHGPMSRAEAEAFIN